MSEFEKYYVKRGDTDDITILYEDETDPDNIIPISLVGATVFFTVKHLYDKEISDSFALISKTVTSHVDAVNGESLIELSSSDTDIEPDEYKADIQIKDSGGDIVSSETFRFIILDDVTKRTS